MLFYVAKPKYFWYDLNNKSDYRKRMAVLALVEEIEKLIDQRVDQRIKALLKEQESMRPWVKINVVMEKLEKDSRWIRMNLCTLDLIEKGLVKKVGGECTF